MKKTKPGEISLPLPIEVLSVLTERVEAAGKTKRLKNYLSLLVRFMCEASLHHSENEWHCVPKSLMRQWTGCGRHQNADEIVTDMKEWGILQCDNKYRFASQGYTRGDASLPAKCLGYQIHPDLLTGVYVEMPYSEFTKGTSAQRLAKIKRKYREFLPTINYIASLEVDLNGVLGYVKDNLGTRIRSKTVKVSVKNSETGEEKSYAKVKERVLDGRIANHWVYSAVALMLGFYHFSRSKTNGRLYSNVTNFPSDLRQFLLLNGRPQVNLDVRNSQPLILNAIEGFGDPKYKAATEGDSFYEGIAQAIYPGLDAKQARSKAKIRFLADFLFAKQGSRLRETSKLVKHIGQTYPQTKAFIDRLMAEGRHLAIELQRKEAEIMIDGVLKELMAMGIKCATIHDSVLCSESDAPIVKAAMEEHFQRCGIEAAVIF